MSLDNLQFDAATMEAGTRAFISLADAGADYAQVYAALRSAGVHGNATHGLIQRLERRTGRRLPGDRPTAQTDEQRTAAIRESMHLAGKLEWRKRGAKFRFNPKTTGTKVRQCAKCGAPVVDSQRAREGHRLRTGCEG